MNPLNAASTAVRNIFSNVAPRGRGPLEVHNLYRLWQATGLRRDDLSGALQCLVDQGFMRAEYKSDVCQYFLVRQPSAPSLSPPDSEQEQRAIEAFLAKAAGRSGLFENPAANERRVRPLQTSLRPAERRKAQRNRLLTILSASEYRELHRHLELVPLERGQLLWQWGDRLRFAYFPLDAIISAELEMRDGACCEVALVGNEGVTDVSVLLGNGTAMTNGRVEKQGFANRISVDVIRQMFDDNAALRSLFLRYFRATLNEAFQGVACNRHHSVDQQVSRLLLSCIDRARSTEVVITHESISNMLGVRREGVTLALGRLKKAGILKCERGVIEVNDRRKLLEVSCECYWSIRGEYERLRASPTRMLQKPASGVVGARQILGRKYPMEPISGAPMKAQG